MTYKKANDILKRNVYVGFVAPTEEEIEAAYDAFGTEEFDTICFDCVHYRWRGGDCERSYNECTISKCNFFKALDTKGKARDDC